MIACIIPARGGSKGIVGKNTIPVCGKPLIGWSIEQAHQSLTVDEICIATDSQEIAAVAMHYRVPVFWRSAESATDTAPTEAVLREVVQGRYQSAEAIVFLQATSPIRQPGDIDMAVHTLRSTNADSVFSARPVVGYTWHQVGDEAVPDYRKRLPRQHEHHLRLEENGSIYVFRPECILEHNNRLAGRIVPYVMHPLDGYQIDEPSDVELIESLMRIRL